MNAKHLPCSIGGSTRQLLKLLFCVILLCQLLLPQVTRAQANLISGHVFSSDDGEPLIGVNVVEKGSTNGTITDLDGKFKLSIKSNSTLVVSYIGYKTQEIAVGNQTNLKVSLELDMTQLDELVVVGYGSVKKSDLTGSVVSMKAESLNAGSNASLEQLMQGRAPGVAIQQKSSEPGGAMSINIRGASSITAGNEPLYVIDGMPINNAAAVSGTGAGFAANNNPRNPLNALNPSDIESIEILKDASATAIYGARGANGVVMITTKKGKDGSLRVSYDTYYGMQTVANQLDLLSATEYKQVLNDIIADGGGNADEEVGEIQEGGTDWQKELVRSAPVQSHNLNFSGSGGNTSYYVSLGYFDQQGVVKESGIKRYTARLNLENGIDKKYKFGINLTTSLIKDDFVSNGVGVNENGGAIYAAINYDPTISIYDGNGNFNRSQFITIDNPVALLEGEQAIADTYRTFGSIFGEYFLLPSLSAKVRIGGDFNSSKRKVWVSPETLDGSQQGGIASLLTGLRTSYLLEGTLNYNKTFGENYINAVAGVTTEEFFSESFTGTGRGFTLPDLEYNAIGSGDPLLNQLGSGAQSARLLSFLGRVNYSIKDRYLITASFRADGSSRFGPSNRFGYFPSAAVAWKMKNEEFLKDVEVLSQLKLRASYGAIGNQSIANYMYLSTLSVGKDVVFGDNKYTTINPSRTPNPDLKWEATNQLDIGLDFGFMEDRIYGTIEYFNRKTTDLLLNVPKPTSLGFGSRLENVGSMQNAGIEFMIDSKNLVGKFKWDTNINFSVIRNKVLDLGDTDEIIAGNLGFVSGASVIRVGEPLNSYYGYIVDGVWQANDDFSVTQDNVAPGDMKFRDLNGDGTINDDDRTIIGSPFPDFSWGLTNTFSYGNFSLSAFIEGVHGNSLLNNNLVDTYFPINFRRNKLAEPYLNRWTESNPSDEYPSFVNPTAQGQRMVNTKTVEDASYIRLQSVRLGYNLPVEKLKYINKLNVYVTGQNLMTFTGYSGVDPASNANGSNILKIDYNAYPLARTFMVGLNIGF
ncbi:TonB-dependent receptor [Limibacter armeniacum]|uniref:SusC/RagA family TonB-linked outer membrane protein n=1 Tax=Limibacter armeniacum TaxID=466084 RepID=UPI002FE673D5